MFTFRKPAVDARDVIKDAARGMDTTTRRAFLRQAVGLGSVTMLAGCDVIDGFSAERALQRISEMNDHVQAWLFDPDKLAPEYPLSAIVDPFPFNAFYRPLTPESAPVVDPEDFTLSVFGAVERDREITLAELHAMPQTAQITRHVCIEGWSAVGRWSGVRFSDFLRMVGADLRKPFVNFRCVDGYATSIDMATALHPQTQLTLRFGKNDEILPRMYGFPMKIRIPTKLGFKNPKHVGEIEVADEAIGGYWETYGYNWHSGL